MGRIADIAAAGFKDSLDQVISAHLQDDSSKLMLLAAIDRDGPEGPNVLKAVTDLQLSFKTKPGLYPSLKTLNNKMKKAAEVAEQPPQLPSEVGGSLTLGETVSIETIKKEEEVVMPKAATAEPKAPKVKKQKEVVTTAVEKHEFTGPSGRMWSIPKGRKAKIQGRPLNFWPKGTPGGVLHTYFENTDHTLDEAVEFAKGKDLKLPVSRFMRPYMGGQYLPYGWVGEQDGNKFRVVYHDPNDVNDKYHADLLMIMQVAFSDSK